MKYCNKCGTQLSDDALFCGNCGGPQPIIQAQEPEQQTYRQFNEQTNLHNFNEPRYNHSTPTLRFIWPKAKSYVLWLSWTPWLNNLNVRINGRTMTPLKGVKFKNGFMVEVPITFQHNIIECWLTTPVIQDKKDFYTKKIDINVNPSYSYIVEIKNPYLFYLTGLKNFIKYRVKDLNGNILLDS